VLTEVLPASTRPTTPQSRSSPIKTPASTITRLPSSSPIEPAEILRSVRRSGLYNESFPVSATASSFLETSVQPSSLSVSPPPLSYYDQLD